MHYQPYFKLFLILTLPFLFFTSCTSKTDECRPKHKIVSPRIINEIKIDVTDSQYSHKFSQTAYFDNTDWYFGLNSSRNCIDIINLTNKNVYKSLCLNNDGSEGSIDITDFYFHNKDSLILFSKFGHIQIINFAGQQIDDFDLRSEKADKWVENKLLSGFESGPPRIYYDAFSKNIYLPSFAPVYQTDDDYLSSPTLVTYNLKSRKYQNIGTLIPNEMKSKKVSPLNDPFEFNIVRADQFGNVIASYKASDLLSSGKLDIQQDSLKLYCRKSRFLQDFTSDFKGDLNDIYAQKKFLVQSGFYEKTVYHQGFKKYLISVRHQQDYKDIEGKVNTPFHAQFSILLLDDNFNPLEEFKIPIEKYNFNKVYPHSEGVLIMKENPNDEHNKEDLLEFSVFDID